MQKKIKLFYLIFLFYSVSAFAQSLTIDTTFLPKAGDYFIENSKVSILDNVSPYDTGVNIIWDFSYATYALGHVTEINTPVAKGVICGNLGSNLATGTGSFVSDCYYVDNSGFYYTGHSQNSKDYSFEQVYITPRPILKINLGFREQYSDTSAYWRTSLGDSVFRGIDIVTLKYDGYGTLKIANKIYDSVIRLHTTRLEVDSIYDTSTNSYYKLRSFFDIYTWHKSGFPVHILTAYSQYSLSWNGTSFDTVKYLNGDFYFLNLPDTTSGSSPMIQRPLDGLTAHFGKDVINIFYESDSVENLIYAVYDVNGKQVLTGNLIVDGKRTTLDVPPVSKGVYILQLKDKNGNERNVKLIKQ